MEAEDIYALNPASEQRLSRKKLPGHGTVIIIDNFYKNPSRISQHIKEELRFDSIHENYPGKVNDGEAIPSDVADAICKVARFKLDLTELEVFFALLHNALPVKAQRFVPHVDDAFFAGICYLSETKSDSGTKFYRHKKYGLNHLYRKRGEYDVDFMAKAYGYASREDYIRDISSLENIDQWEVIADVEMVYNRLIVFDANCFHGIGINDPLAAHPKNNPRVTQNFFFQVVENVRHTGCYDEWRLPQ